MRQLQGLFVAAIAIVLAACSGKTIVPTYEGEKLAANQQAVLIAGENIELISVNGKPVPKYLLSNIEVKYGLKPGLNRVVFQYRSVWTNHARGQDGPRAVEVTSGPREVAVNAVAGETLRFEYPQPDNRRDAERLAANYKAVVVNQAGKELGSSGPVTPVVAEPAGGAVAVAAAPSAASPAVVMPAPGAAGQPSASQVAVVAPAPVQGAPLATPAPALPTIEGLKVLWGQASTEEKKAFLKWAFQ